MNLNIYLADRTCQHVHEQVGTRSSFRDNMFHVGPRGEIPVYNGYEIRFEDEGKVIKLIVERESAGVEGLLGGLGDLKVDGHYQDVVTSAYAEKSERDVEKTGEIKMEKVIVVTARMSGKDNRAGRTNSRDKIFFAVYHTIVRPVLRAAYEAP